MKILVTGAAGFIGFHLVQRLLTEGHEVLGLDNLNDYYDPRLKYDRLEESGIPALQVDWNSYVQSETQSKYRFIRLDVEHKESVEKVFYHFQPETVVHLAAQVGVRYSIEHPDVYIQSNITGFLNMLEGCRRWRTGHLVFASSSSVFGLNENMPYSTSDNVDHPISLYAATKKSNELMAHTYSHLYGLPVTGLRFFTVYGPWGRPDMSYSLFAKNMQLGKPIQVFNNGEMARDFTYVDDIVEGIFRVAMRPPVGNVHWSGQKPDPSSSAAPFKIYNIGNGKPVPLLEFIAAIENEMGVKALKEWLPIQPGDVMKTWADITDLKKDFNYLPQTHVPEGITKFVRWFKNYYSQAVLV